MQPIFIGGTGRSGTTIALHALYKHHQIYAVPIETKFIVQVDGLATLVDHLSDRYSITDGPVAIARFEQLMRDVITFQGPNPYQDYRGDPYGRQGYLPQDLFANYQEAIDRFFASVQNRHHPRQVAVALARSLVDDLFGVKAESMRKTRWAEKTPSNITRIEFLFEMYPDAKFINCVRDPRGVLHSLLRLQWIVPEIDKAADFLASYYQYIEEKRAYGRALGSSYMELRLEALVSDPKQELDALTNFLELEPFDADASDYLLTKLRQGSVRWNEEAAKYCDAWETEFSEQERATATAILGEALRNHGYPE